MSEELELKLKRRIQIIVVTAMSLFFVLVTAAIFTTAWHTSLTAEVNRWKNVNNTLEANIVRAQNDEIYYRSDEFKYDYALRHLDRGRPGDIVIL